MTHFANYPNHSCGFEVVNIAVSIQLNRPALDHLAYYLPLAEHDTAAAAAAAVNAIVAAELQ